MSKSSLSSSLEDRLDSVQRELAAQQRKLVGRTRFTGFIAAIVLVALSVYFYYGYTQLNELTEAAKLVALAEITIVDNLAPARRILEDEIKSGAPGWADQLSREVQESLPQAREELEKYIVEQMKMMIDATGALTEEQLRGFFKDNHDVLERGLQDLSSSPDMAEQTMQELMAALDKQLSKQMHDEALELFATLSLMSEKLAKLKSGRGLNAEQQLERQVLMLFRRLQTETVEPGIAVRPASSAGASRVAVVPDGTAPDETTSADEKPDVASQHGENEVPGASSESETADPPEETAAPPDGESAAPPEPN
ncbi:MAG TPA: hypothetical protein VND64_32430 [Pirellulales bacterium]|nr:hypothetical protein [Pirellulales bacterium]